MSQSHTENFTDGIAVIGMSGRYPGARNLQEFWTNLKNGRETISYFTEEQLLQAGFDAELVADPSFVKARPVYDGAMNFDAPFFGYTPREADIIDPQQRVFLEAAWEAMEDSGYDPTTFPGPISLYAGTGMTYYLFGLIDNQAVMSTMGGLAVTTSNEKDYLATRVGYKLNLRGPCVTLQTACSTSLVGIIFGCQSLLSYQADLAMAGGATIAPNDIGGYYYTEGGIVSPDGHNRSFDAAGRGTIFGSGTGVVVLKRLQDAIADRDNIRAVIRGFAVNNDGSAKAGFTAPGVEGQAAVCLEALGTSGIHPDTLQYIECHGTATPLGDLVEVTALSKAFREYTSRKQYCAIGSVKTNIGHMDSAAGVAGFTKVVLSLENKALPPSLHFENPNPEIDFKNSPFFVNTKLTDLHSNGTPIRAAISSFGVGGTNAHVIVEEAPAVKSSEPSRASQLLVLSARSNSALEKMTLRLADYLESHPGLSLADVAFTLQKGRKLFQHRRMLVCQTREEAIHILRGGSPGKMLTLHKDQDAKSVAFLFPGQGSQHPNMARDVYHSELLFRETVDHCAAILEPLLQLDLRDVLFPHESGVSDAAERLTQTRFAQPALFVIEYAMARLWMSWGIRPDSMAGHSIGEYVAACLAGVFSLDDALKLVARRGALMQALPTGSMLGVLMPESELQQKLSIFPQVSIAAVNGPMACVASGPTADIDALEAQLEKETVPSRRLHTSHAFHSAMMESIVPEFEALMSSVKLSAPTLPYLSNLTGSWITGEQAVSPSYWAQHLRQAVRFSENAAVLLESTSRVLLEIGPGRTLGSLVTQHSARKSQAVLSSLPHVNNDAPNDSLLTTAGRLWFEGKPLDWDAFHGTDLRRRVSLPSYPFEHQRYAIDLAPKAADTSQISHKKIQNISKWFYYQSFKRIAPLPAAVIPDSGCCLIFHDDTGLGDILSRQLSDAGWDAVHVYAHDHFELEGDSTFRIRPGNQEDYSALVSELSAQDRAPNAVLHLWNVGEFKRVASELESYQDLLDRGFMSMFYLAPALNLHFASTEIKACVVSSDTYDVTGDGVALPTKAAVAGPCRAVIAECPNIAIRTVDVRLPDGAKREQLASRILDELFAPAQDEVIAYRGDHRWMQQFDRIPLEAPDPERRILRSNAVYLITGGLGGLGLVIADAIAQRVPAKIVLLGRSGLPDRAEWQDLKDGSDLRAEKIRRVLRMEQLGSEVMVLSADVGDLHQMRGVVKKVEEQFGPVDGVVHSAGVAGGGIMLLKTPEMIDSVLRPKIRGTLVLEELFKTRKMDFFILCSSLNSFLGEGGISDYIGANAFLDSFANSRKDALTPPLAVQWDSWEDVGMVAEGWFNAPKTTGRSREKIDHPVFEERITESESQTFVIHMTPSKHWVVGEHVLMGKPTLVGTTHLQFAEFAFDFIQGSGPVELRDVVFLAPMTLAADETRELHIVMEEQSSGSYGFNVKSRKGNTWQSHAIGRIGRYEGEDHSRLDVKSILARCEPLEEQTDTVYGPNEERVPFLQFGNRWRNLEEKTFGKNEAVGILSLYPEFYPDLELYGLHPAVMDRATGFAVFRAGSPGSHYLPFAYNRVRVLKPLTERIYSHVRFQPGDEYISLNISLYDENGGLLVQIDGYEVKRVPDELLASGDAELVGSGNEVEAVEAQQPVSKIAKPSVRILSSDGAGVFYRLLTLESYAQVAVACRELGAVRAEIQGVLGARSGGSSDQGKLAENLHPRPELATVYAEPRNDLERAVAQIWQNLLGIEQIGIDDDFLELGGNSLLGIQIASRIRSEFEIELSVATFYKAPTIRTLAESIIESLQSGLNEEDLAAALDELEGQEMEENKKTAEV